MRIGHARLQSWFTIVVDKYCPPFKQPGTISNQGRFDFFFAEIGEETIPNIMNVQKAETIVISNSEASQPNPFNRSI